MNSPKSSASARVNVRELLNRVDNDRQLLHELFSIFKEEFPGNLQNLRAAVAAGNLPEAAKLSHTLKGTLSNLAVGTGAASAAALEHAARSGDSTHAQAAFADFDRTVAGLLSEFEACLAEAHPS